MAKRFGAEDLAGLKGQITLKLEEKSTRCVRVTKRAFLIIGQMVSRSVTSVLGWGLDQIAHQLWRATRG
jgi:trigger factor